MIGLLKTKLWQIFEKGVFCVTKEHFKGMLHIVAVFGNSAFSSESDAPIIEGKAKDQGCLWSSKTSVILLRFAVHH